MNTAERSIELAKRVNQVLSQYIVIHDDIFGFSIRKIIPIPGIFKVVDYAGYMASLSTMSGQLNQIGESIDSFLEREPGSSPTASFLAALKEYSNALSQTIGLLNTVCYKLHLKNENSGTTN